MLKNQAGMTLLASMHPVTLSLLWMLEWAVDKVLQFMVAIMKTVGGNIMAHHMAQDVVEEETGEEIGRLNGEEGGGGQGAVVQITLDMPQDLVTEKGITLEFFVDSTFLNCPQQKGQKFLNSFRCTDGTIHILLHIIHFPLS